MAGHGAINQIREKTKGTCNGHAEGRLCSILKGGFGKEQRGFFSVFLERGGQRI